MGRYMTDKEIEAKYTPDEIEDIYRYQEMKYTVEDAKFHIEEFIDWHELTEEEAQKLYDLADEMAYQYLYKYADCSMPENSVWEALVETYYYDKVNE